MAKSKKKKQEDFQKVKLKVGKRLPKGQNVTNTSFKTRSIQVVQQMKSDGSQPSTHRKLNISDLLSKCQHYSISVRQEGITGLRELLTSFPAMITSHLSSVIEKTLPLISDKDNNVRQATLKLFHFIFPNTPTHRIEPFFPIVSAHLCCAMTHIYDEIQHDSLELFDVLLETYPLLIANNSGQLLQNFIEQISRQQNISKKGQSSNISLAVKPDSRFSVQRWRSGILSRVFKLLSALLEWRFPDTSQLDQTNLAPTFKTGNCVPTQYSSRVTNIWSSPGYRIQSSAAKSLSSSGKEDNQFHFASSLVPLLVQCWVESRSTQGHSKKQVSDNLVWPSSMSVMYNVMKVLHLLWMCVDRETDTRDDASESLWEKHHKEFIQHFMTHFPYSVQDTPVHMGKKNKKTTPTVSAEDLNLSICEVMTCLISGHDKNSPSLCSSIGEYLCVCLDMQYTPPDLNKTLVSILHRFTVVCPDTELLESILGKAVTRYEMAHPLSTEKRLYLELFTSLFLDTDMYIPKLTSLQDRFFKSLPCFFPIVHKENPKMAALIVRVMRQAASQNCRPLLENLPNSLLIILEINGGAFINVDETLQRGLIDMMHWLPHFNKYILHALVNVCHHDNVAVSEALYLLDMVHNKFQLAIEAEIQSEAGVAVTTSYLSFLLSILSGGRKLYPKMELYDQDGCQVTSALHFIWCETAAQWQKHCVIVQRVCYHLQQLPDISVLTVIIWNFWKQLLMSAESLHITTVFSVLVSLTTFNDCEKSFDKSLSASVGNLALSLAVEMVTMVTSQDHLTQVTNQLWECLTRCLITVPSFLIHYFLKGEEFLQSFGPDRCLLVLTSMLRLLQDQPVGNQPPTVNSHLENIQHIVKTRYPENTETQQWKDFQYFVHYCHNTWM